MVTCATFTHRKPGRAAHLTSLAVSEIFPSGVIAYNPGRLDEDTLQRFRNGMTNAKENIMGRQMLMLWKLTSFEPVPEDYGTICANIIKHYPPPIPTESHSSPVHAESAKPIAEPAKVEDAKKAPEPVAAPKAEPAAAPTKPEPEPTETEPAPTETEPAPLEPTDSEATPPLPDENPEPQSGDPQ
jgi:hypothetical protein